MSDEKKQSPTHYELPAGAIAILEEILPSPEWYKDDAKQGLQITRAVAALEALPETDKRPKPETGEDKEAFQERVAAWSAVLHSFEWTDKHRDSVKVCVRFFLKKGAFMVNDNTVSLLKLLSLDDE